MLARVLTARQPRNAVAWIVGVIAVVFLLGGLTNGYMASAPDGDPLIVFQLAGLLSGFVWNLWLPGLVAIALPLVFPDGRPLWHWVAWLARGGTLVGMVAIGLAPGPGDRASGPNPFGIEGAGELLSAVEQVGIVSTSWRPSARAPR